MLDTLLRILSEGGSFSSSDLAKRLGVGEELLHEMIERLVGLGYLRSLAGSCGQNCGQCAQSGACCVGVQGQAWSLTEKGRRAAGRIHDAAG
ncbi:MAG TPA: Lrp/AsnC family transcriptional regulator [Anaerolineae bacterium]|nr:Lrp/AsnC family transcriptional regulator [Anaerolineae bacterium]